MKTYNFNMLSAIITDNEFFTLIAKIFLRDYNTRAKKKEVINKC